MRKVINENLPDGYEEGMQFGMIGWYVPLSLYPAGYGENPKAPLPFVVRCAAFDSRITHALIPSAPSLSRLPRRSIQPLMLRTATLAAPRLWPRPRRAVKKAKPKK